MITILALVIIFLTTTYIYFKQSYGYWKRKKLPYIPATFPLGNMANPMKKVAPAIQFKQFYEFFKERKHQHGGVYVLSNPVYMPIDPEYVKNVMSKDFHHFMDRGLYSNEEDQPILGNLFFLQGLKWKTLRQKLSPTFTSGKMRMMFHTMLDCTPPLVKHISELTADNLVIDVKEVLARFNTDVIGSCAFGIRCNSFEDAHSDFRMYGKKIFDETTWKTLKGIFQFAFPNLSKQLHLLVIERDVEKFFTKVVTETYEYRKQNNIERNDFMQLLIELKDKGNILEEKLDAITMNELIAQAFIFFIAGFDTSSTAIMFSLYELCVNVDIQTKLREEIQKVLHQYSGSITYEAVQEMKYLEQVIEEALRKYPPVSLLNRICTETYKVPNTNLFINRGTEVCISVMGLHRDPEYYPDPERFNPDRFSAQNKQNIRSGTYIPFGDGPRVCIGVRFGLMQVKIALITLLKNFEFSLSERTNVPLEFGLGFILTAEGGVWLNSKRLKNV